MRPFVILGLVSTGLISLSASQKPDVPVVVTAVVTDADGQPVRGLTQTHFSLKENGRAAAITGFRAFTEADATTSGRTVVLMLGTGTSPDRTTTVQDIARLFLSRAGQADRVSVVRFENDRDELSGTRADMLMRVAEFRALTTSPVYDKTQEDVLREVRDLARDLRSERIDRQAIVWIGPAAIADVIEPALGRHDRVWPYWVDALTAAARARLSMYVVDPHGLTGRVRLSPDGLVAQTGGLIVDNTNDFASGVSRIWNDLGSHYALEYAGSAENRELYEIDVTVDLPGARVRATNRR
jgi:VWFA-related protein